VWSRDRAYVKFEPSSDEGMILARVVLHSPQEAARAKRARKAIAAEFRGGSTYSRKNGAGALVRPAHHGWSGGAFYSPEPAVVRVAKDAKPIGAKRVSSVAADGKRAAAPSTAAPASREATRRKSGAR
jgi:hypothetical protein